MASPIWELGVEAPAVSPMRTGPSGSQPLSSISSLLSSGVSCWFVADGVTLYAVAARYVVAVRDPLVSDDRQVVRVRGIVPSNNDHKVQRILQ